MTAPIAHGGAIATAAVRYGGDPAEWLDLSTGINPCPPNLPLIDPNAWHRLPDRSLVQSASEVARDFYRSGAILPLAVPGTQAAIQLLPRLVAPGKRVAVVWPTYGEYERALTAAGLDVDRLDGPEDASERHGLVVVVNPNNPTGRSYSIGTLEGLADKLRTSGGLLVVDEAFADVDNAVSLVPAVEHHDNLVVFRSFGKFFGLAGIRLGFVVTASGRASAMAEWLGPWAVSGPALSVAASLMSGDTRIIGERITERHAASRAVLDGARLTVIGGASLFSLVEHPQAGALYENLCTRHILTRPFDYAPTWLRFGLAPDAAGDERLADALATFGGR